MKNATIAALAAVVAATTSCSSIVSKSQYPVAVTSATKGVKFDVKNGEGKTIHSAATPSTVTLKAGNGYFKKADYTFDFKKGNKVETLPVTATIDPWYFGNLGIGGIIGMVGVDPATGAMYKLPKDIGGQKFEIF